MSYIIEILRIDDTGKSSQISKPEWEALVQDDPQLDAKNSDVATWNAHPSNQEIYFSWHPEGAIHGTSPDEPTLIKMQEIAKKLNARLRGEEGEMIDEVEPTPDKAGCGTLILVLLAMLVHLI